MKKWNKLLALLLAMVMAFGMTVTAFAEEAKEPVEGTTKRLPLLRIPPPPLRARTLLLPLRARMLLLPLRARMLPLPPRARMLPLRLAIPMLLRPTGSMRL